MTQERLSDLFTMSIGIKIYEKLNYDDLMVKFSEAKKYNFV